MTKPPIIESYWVKENLFLAGEYPGASDPAELRRRMDAFLESGIRAFIDLTQPHELPSYEAVLKEEARRYDCLSFYHRFAIRDHGIPSIETMRLILDTIDSSIQSGSPVYVHCWGGVGRTGAAVGCYLARHGLSPHKALARVNELYRTRPKNYFFQTSPETEEQARFIENWREVPASSRTPGRKFCEG